MRSILQQKSLRFVFIANVVSMLGSGMNTTGVAWYVLQATHSKVALGTLVAVQTLPALLLLPFTRLLSSRYKRGPLFMLPYSFRASLVLAIALSASSQKAKAWKLYPMA